MKHIILLLTILWISFSSCSNSSVYRQDKTEIVADNFQITEQNKNESQTNDTSVDFPDFKNFKYPQFCVEGDSSAFLMKNGEYKDKDNEFLFTNVKYLDVTGDNKKEAIVILDVISGGSSMPQCVYIFQAGKQKSKKVKLLWEFFTGDRAYGGLRNIYEKNGNLVVEKYVAEDKSASCCAKFYIQETYNWENSRFKKQTEEKFLNSDERFSQ